jgi:calcium-dependent protein kinase
VAGVVRKCKHRDSGVEFAVKVLNLGLIENDAVLEALREEVFIMCQLDHPNILRLEEVYESETQIFLIQELCSGGDLFDRLEEQPDYHYSEVQCAKLVKQMMSALRYLHSKGIVHRDLKLENFLFDDKTSDSLKMIDFGLSKHFNKGAVEHEAVGTPYTVAPEVIKGSYNEKVDIWGMGVITYLLLSGDSPFGGIDGEPLMHVRQNILKCQLSFEPKEIWDQVSEEGKNFVRRLLTKDPEKRPTARQAQRDEWLQVYANMDVEDSKALSTNLVNNLLQFKDYSDMHRVLLEVLSFTLLPEQIHKLKTQFEKVDPDGNGEIRLEELKEVLLNKAEAGALGSLSEKEVEDIFNALRIQESETTIRWHEFIAAGLSQCDIDDRNIRLAFDRLDYDRKGYVKQCRFS